MTDRAPLLSSRFAWRPLAGRYAPTPWDVAVFGLVIGGLALIAVGGRETLQPIAVANRTPLSLDPANLPDYALRTTLRMFAAMAASLLFTFGYGALAAKSRRAELVLVPLLDILQSVPVVGFLTFTVTFFLALFPGQVLGAEFAAIFAVFTSQAWNMAFSFYHSLKNVPKDLRDVSDQYRLGSWKRFWTLEAPYAAPGLVWNAMISMSGGWFFVTLSETVTVGNISIALPGVGSYLALAIVKRDLAAVGWAVLTMFVVILLYDQLLFRPLVAWSEKFRMGGAASGSLPPRSWVLDFLQRADLARRILRPAGAVLRSIGSVRLGAPVAAPRELARVWSSPWVDGVWIALIGGVSAYAVWRVVQYVGAEVRLAEAGLVVLYGFYTLLRVLVLIVLASLVWTPVGVWIGLRPRVAQAVQPVAQFLAAFPANLFFPVFVLAIVRWKLQPDIWLSPLMILGTQWYILFNVIAGASVLPVDLREVAASFRVSGISWWRKVALPGVLPYYLTGAITASGGSWNAAMVAEVAAWGSTVLTAHGLGAYIFTASQKGDFPRVVLGVAVMSLYVVLFNTVVWRPLFSLAARRLRAD